jgi:hypothetical protein
MARRKYKLLKIVGWILASLVFLVLLLTLVFYLGRNFFMEKAVNYLNEQQPGEVQMGQMNLIPFLHFPDITLQLQSVDYYEQKIHPDSAAADPVISLDKIHVTLDALDLIRGSVMVSELKLEEGRIRLEVYEDSISNLEYALGIRFGGKHKERQHGIKFFHFGGSGCHRPFRDLAGIGSPGQGGPVHPAG